MRCPRCPSQVLRDGGVLSSSTCGRCGGALVPNDGAERLLTDDLGHDRAQLQELASLFAGARLGCPACHGRMSPLQLRGAMIDLCFQCGALWLDSGELEQVSSGRYQQLARPLVARAAAAPPAATQALVRIDERPPWVRALRSTLWLYGGLGFGAALLGSALAPTVVFTLPALAGAIALSRRRVTEVLPRARRVQRWAGMMRPDRPRSDDELPAESVVRVGALPVWRGELLRTIELVDPEGRVIATPRHLVSVKDAAQIGEQLASALGLPLRDDVPRPPEPLEELPARVAPHEELTIREDERAPKHTTRLVISSADGSVVATAHNAAPLPETPRSLSALLRGDWLLSDADGAPLARFLPSTKWGQHASLLIAPDGAVLGHVRVQRSFFFDVVEWASPARKRIATLRMLHGTADGTVKDARGVLRGALHLTRSPLRPATVRLSYRPSAYPGATRTGVIASAVHASLAAAVVELGES